MSRDDAIWAVVPIKGGGRAKQRLSPALAPALRSAFARAMAEDVLCALRATRALAGVLVVTDDDDVAAIAARHGARCLRDAPARERQPATGDAEGYTAAALSAAAVLQREHAAGMLCVPGDVPLMTPRDVEEILDAHRRARDFVIVPSRDMRGSNGILCAPPGGVQLRYGNDSFAGHLAAARSAGIEPVVLRIPGIELDIDHPDDLAWFMREPSATCAYRVLRDAA